MAVSQISFRNAHTIVDLSMPISAEMPTYPGDRSPRIEPLSTIKEGGANTTRIILGAHTGTHVDVPYHLLERGQTVDELPLETFCGSALTYDLADNMLGSRVGPDDLKRGIPLKSGEIALFYTGSNAPAASGSTSRPYTCLDSSMADCLIEKQVRAVGIDSMSVDPLGSPKNEVHKMLLQNGIVIFENLSDNLRLLTGQRVLFFGAPLRLKRADASPIRAFALL
jgi:kynurenine formamidase